MEIRYRTKKESNQEQEAAFLALPPGERFMQFLKLSRRVLQFETRKPREEKSKNFIIRRQND